MIGDDEEYPRRESTSAWSHWSEQETLRYVYMVEHETRLGYKQNIPKHQPRQPCRKLIQRVRREILLIKIAPRELKGVKSAEEAEGEVYLSHYGQTQKPTMQSKTLKHMITILSTVETYIMSPTPLQYLWRHLIYTSRCREKIRLIVTASESSKRSRSGSKPSY